MYKIVYDRDDGKRFTTDYKNVTTYAEVQDVINELLNDNAVTDIYLCRQIYYINAIVERQKK